MSLASSIQFQKPNILAFPRLSNRLNDLELLIPMKSHNRLCNRLNAMEFLICGVTSTNGFERRLQIMERHSIGHNPPQSIIRRRFVIRLEALEKFHGIAEFESLPIEVLQRIFSFRQGDYSVFRLLVNVCRSFREALKKDELWKVPGRAQCHLFQTWQQVARQHYFTQQSLKEQMLCSNILLDEMGQQELLLLINYNPVTLRPMDIGPDSLAVLSEIALANVIDFLEKRFFFQLVHSSNLILHFQAKTLVGGCCLGKFSDLCCEPSPDFATGQYKELIRNRVVRRLLYRAGIPVIEKDARIFEFVFRMLCNYLLAPVRRAMIGLAHLSSFRLTITPERIQAEAKELGFDINTVYLPPSIFGTDEEYSDSEDMETLASDDSITGFDACLTTEQSP